MQNGDRSCFCLREGSDETEVGVGVPYVGTEEEQAADEGEHLCFACCGKEEKTRRESS